MATPEGRAELATTVRDAMHSVGFFYVVGHGLPTEKVSQSFLTMIKRASDTRVV